MISLQLYVWFKSFLTTYVTCKTYSDAPKIIQYVTCKERIKKYYKIKLL